MAQTLYATFANPNNAQSAAAEMLQMGIGKDEISLFFKRDGHMKESTESVDLMDTRPTTPMQGTEFNHGPDPLGNGLRQLSVSRIERGVDADIHHVAAERDPNAGVQEPAEPRMPYLDVSDSNESEPYSRGFNAVSADSPQNIKIDPDADAYRDTDPQVKPGATIGDVGHGAAHGAGIGLGVGALAAVATMLIPGLGMVIGAGTLATAMAALVTGAGAGALAGGLTGFLTQHGVPEEEAARFAQIHEKGGAILAVSVFREEMRETVDQILRKHGAVEVESHQAYLS
jgi:hypothetical protein